MLNKQVIYNALSKAPLCSGSLIKQAGMATEYCAMAALAKDVGATDSYLRSVDSGGYDIWRDFGEAIQAQFGIETYEQFTSFMHVNDKEQYSTRRNAKVLEHVEALSAEQVNKILQVGVTEPTADILLQQVKN